MTTYRQLVDGELCNSASGATFDTLDPGTGDVIATVPLAGLKDVDNAVAAARRAFDSGVWSGKTPQERAHILLELADLIQMHTTQLAMVEALDSGGVLARTASDVFQGARFIRSMANHAALHFPWKEEVQERNFPFHSVNTVVREPIGVCAGIIPWNFPFLMAIWKLGMALAGGNTLVLKPAQETPLSALLLGEIIAKSRIPKGVVNIIVGDGPLLGEALCTHPGVDKVAFTGSTRVGKRVMELASQGIKRVSTELGGKSANIVLPDADMDLAVDGALFGVFLHSGQVCESGTRLFLPRASVDPFMKAFVDRARAIKVGYQLDPSTRMGPVVSEKQRTTIERYIATGTKEGAKLLLGGERPKVSGFEKGLFVGPTVFGDVTNSMTIAREEIFGPVLCVMPYDSVDDVVALANDSTYGLAAGIWSRNLHAAQTLAGRIKAGTVWINDYHVFHDLAPFGGFKQSGSGRELGHHGLLEYTEVKHVHVGTEGDPNAKLGHRMVVKRGRPLGFEYEPTTRIISGPGSVNRLLSELAALHKERVLLITDKGVTAAGIVEAVKNVLGHRIAAIFDSVPQDSGLDIIDAAAAMGRVARVDCVLSVGGGSVIDTAKGVAVALGSGMDAIQTLGMHQLLGPQMFHVVVPTTAGTGSEVTNVAVIKNHALRVKGYIVDRFVVPDLAILDPVLTVGLPAGLTASTGMDALTHAIEAYTSKLANPMSDAQALHAIRTISMTLPVAVKDGKSLEARSAMQSAATLAGWAIGSANVGLVHGMCHALGARYGVAHGVGNGILLPHVMRFNASVPQAAERLKHVAMALGVNTSGMSAVDAASAGADAVETLLKKIGHPLTLREVNVPEAELEATANQAFVDPANMTNARRVAGPGEVEALYRQAW